MFNQLQQNSQNPEQNQTNSSEQIQSVEVPNIESLLAEVDAAIDSNCVMHGSRVTHINLAGQTVGSVRKTFRPMWNISTDAIALVDGQEVSDDYYIKVGQQVEFVKESGIKGATGPREILTSEGFKNIEFIEIGDFYGRKKKSPYRSCEMV